jgi:hypothetical protein
LVGGALSPDYKFLGMLLTFNDVYNILPEGRSHLLIGNGFSIAADPIFKYQNLYEAAVSAGLSEEAIKIFDYLGTNNFEGVLQLLDDTGKVAEIYGAHTSVIERISKDTAVIKDALVSAVAISHLEHSGVIATYRKDRALEFLKIFHNVFTTNYDLLTYWVVMSSGQEPIFQDGFRSPEDDDEPYVIFKDRLGDSRGLYYLHGALHLYLNGGELRKHTWCRTGTKLTEQIRSGLSQGQHPLFVAEGSSDKKLAQIQRHGYLWYSLSKLSNINSPLVIYGHSLSEHDKHLIKALTDNLKLGNIFIGLFGEEKSPENLRIQRTASQMIAERDKLLLSASKSTKGKKLSVKFFDSASAKVWG